MTSVSKQLNELFLWVRGEIVLLVPWFFSGILLPLITSIRLSDYHNLIILSLEDH